jgi:hypothetical protein
MAIAVTAIVPPSDRITGGAAATILGSGLIATPTVTVGGVSATSVVLVSATKITCIVPAGAAGPVNVVVTNPDTTFATLVNGFTFYTPTADLTQVVIDLAGRSPALMIGTIAVSRSSSQEQATFQVNDQTVPPFTPVKIGLGSLAASDLLFIGKEQITKQSAQAEILSNPLWDCTVAGSLAEFNRQLVWGSYLNSGADIVAIDLIQKFAPDFTWAHIPSGLAIVTASFQGDTMDTAFTTLKTLIGGYYYRDDSYDVHLFITETPDLTPDPLDDANKTLILNTLTWQADVSQIRNRVIGIGASTTLVGATAAGETTLPVASTAMLTAGTILVGGTLVLSYTGASHSAPLTAPLASLSAGSGIDAGSHDWAFSFKTAAGETAPSPLSTVVVATAASPTTPNVVNVYGSTTSGLTPGVYQYAGTYVAGGESLPCSPISCTIMDATNPTTAPSVALAVGLNEGSPPQTLYFKYAWASQTVSQIVTPGPWTLCSPASVGITVPDSTHNVVVTIPVWNGGTPQPADVWAWLFVSYSGAGGPYRAAAHIGVPGGTIVYPIDGTYSVNEPITNNLQFRSVSFGFSVIPGATSMNIYRTVVNGSQLKLCATGLGPGAFFQGDAVADGSLGVNAPTVSAAATAQVQLNGITVGPTGTTARNIYRTTAGTSGVANLKLQQVVGDNATISGIFDAMPDVSLGVAPPTIDTSGLTITPVTTTSGSRAAGSTTLGLTSAALFSVGGGWVSVTGMTVRYTSISGSVLQGIPATGPGSILQAIASGAVVTGLPVITGVSALVPLTQGSSVALYSSRDNLASQATVKAIEGGKSTGIYEFKITDASFVTQTSLDARCDAELLLFAAAGGILQANYVTFDKKSRYGRPLHVAMPWRGLYDPAIYDPAIYETELFLTGDFVIQTVSVSDVGVYANSPPRYACMASSVRFTLEDLLRHVVTG